MRSTSDSEWPSGPMNGEMPRHMLFLCHLPWLRGGSQYATGRLVKAVADAGHRVTVVSPVAEGQQPGARLSLSLGSVRVHEFALPAVGGVFLGYRGEIDPPGVTADEYFTMQAQRALPLMRDVVDNDPPDVIIFGHEVLLWNTVDTVRDWGFPTALIAHGPLAAIVNGEMRDDWVEPLLANVCKVDLVMPVADYMTRYLRGLGPDARTLRNALETDRFHPGVDAEPVRRTLGLDASDIVVAHASTLRPIKRVMDIIDSAAEALVREPRLVYLVYGDGAMQESLERRSRQLGIAARVRFLGWVPHAEMHDHMRAADMSVLSSASEGMPYAALESLSSGRPVVTSALAWTWEIQECGPCMFTFPAGDVSALAEATLQAAADGSLRARMGGAGRAFVEDHHRTDRVVDSFMSAVAPLMTRNTAREGGRSHR